jgi:hypothetical protein
MPISPTSIRRLHLPGSMSALPMWRCGGPAVQWCHVGHTGLQFTLVDCPGHASLIRTIIGGAQVRFDNVCQQQLLPALFISVTPVVVASILASIPPPPHFAAAPRCALRYVFPRRSIFWQAFRHATFSLLHVTWLLRIDVLHGTYPPNLLISAQLAAVCFTCCRLSRILMWVPHADVPCMLTCASHADVSPALDWLASHARVSDHRLDALGHRHQQGDSDPNRRMHRDWRSHQQKADCGAKQDRFVGERCCRTKRCRLMCCFQFGLSCVCFPCLFVLFRFVSFRFVLFFG